MFWRAGTVLGVTAYRPPRPGEDVLERLVVLPADVPGCPDVGAGDAMLPAGLRADVRRFAADTRDALDRLGSLGRLGDLATLAHPPADVLTDPNVAEALADLPADKLAALADCAAAELADLPANVPAALTALSADTAIDMAGLTAELASREAERVAGRDGGWAKLGYELSARVAETLAGLPGDKRDTLRRLGVLPAAGLGRFGSSPAESLRRLGALTGADLATLDRLATLTAVDLITLGFLGGRGHTARLDILAAMGTMAPVTLAGLHRLGVLDADTLAILRHPFVTSHRSPDLFGVYAVTDLADLSQADLVAVSELTMRAGTPNAPPDANVLCALWFLGRLDADTLHRLASLSATEALAELSADDPTVLSADDRVHVPASELSGSDPAQSAFRLGALRRLHVHRGGLEEDTLRLLRQIGGLDERTVRVMSSLANMGALDRWGSFNNALDQGGLPDDVRTDLIARAATTEAAGQYMRGLITVWGGIRPLAAMSALLRLEAE